MCSANFKIEEFAFRMSGAMPDGVCEARAMIAAAICVRAPAFAETVFETWSEKTANARIDAAMGAWKDRDGREHVQSADVK